MKNARTFFTAAALTFSMSLGTIAAGQTIFAPPAEAHGYGSFVSVSKNSQIPRMRVVLWNGNAKLLAPGQSSHNVHYIKGVTGCKIRISHGGITIKTILPGQTAHFATGRIYTALARCA